MDIENLNKSQIVLLTLLVSFVTSIATGIVTVSLMDQAPPVIPQTINRVVERTVERVVPEAQTATVITTEKTVVVKEADLVAQAVTRARPALIDVRRGLSDKTEEVLARGAMLSKQYAITGGVSFAVGTDVLIGGQGSSTPGRVVAVDEDREIAIIYVPESQAPALSVSTDALTLGQSVIALLGLKGVSVASGIVASVAEGKTIENEIYQASFATNVASTEFSLGNVLVNTEGAVIGIYAGDAKALVPARMIMQLFNSLAAQKTPGEVEE